MTNAETTASGKPTSPQRPLLPTSNAYMNRLYMYRIKNEQGDVTYKVDIFSRNQVGRGQNQSGRRALHRIISGSGWNRELFGGVGSRSGHGGFQRHRNRQADPDSRREVLGQRIHRRETASQNIEDLVIYELHVGSLGYPSTASGTFADAMAFVDKLVELGVNAVELLPVLEFDGDLQWGYGTSLFFCMQTSQGGAQSTEAFHTRLPSAWHRRHSGRGVQPLRDQRQRANGMGLRF